MTPPRYDFVGDQRIYEGINWVRSFTLGTMASVNDPVSTLVPRDLTGYTEALLVIRETPKGNEAGGREVLRISLTGGEITLGGTAGTVSWNVPFADMDGLNFDRGVYWLELTDPTGTVRTLELQGRVEYARRVNR